MGVDFYVAVPSAKLLVYIGRSISDSYLEAEADKLSNLIRYLTEEEREISMIKEALEKNANEISLSELACIVNLARKVISLDEDYLPKAMLYLVLKRIDKDAKIVVDVSEEYERLLEEGYTIV